MYPRGTCQETAQAMVKDFPELTRVRGFYNDVLQGERPHWWCVDLEGEIVDPTAAQFAPCGEYLPYDESLGEPRGQCLNCGGLMYDTPLVVGVCSEACFEEAKANSDCESLGLGLWEDGSSPT